MSSKSEDILAGEFSGGDVDAFAEIYNRYAPALRRFVTGIIKNRTQAEDIVHNIFLRMMSSRPVFENASALRNWLYVCARNETVSFLRTKWESKVVKISDYPEILSDGLSADHLDSIIESVLQKMPQKRSEVFRMNKLGGLSAEDIASRLGISVRTVQKHLELANRDVKKILS